MKVPRPRTTGLVETALLLGLGCLDKTSLVVLRRGGINAGGSDSSSSSNGGGRRRNCTSGGSDGSHADGEEV
jgi:hypothetical protein